MARLYFEYYSKEQDGTKPKYRYCPNCATELQDVVLVHHERRACQHCGFIQHLNPLPGVCIVVEMDGRVLIGRRKSASVLGDRWCLPCGYIDHEESFLEAAHREVLEETNLKIKLTSLMDVSSNHISPTLHSIVPILTATVVEGTATPGDDIEELRWISRDCELPEMAFISDPNTIRRYFSGDFGRVSIGDRYETM